MRDNFDMLSVYITCKKPQDNVNSEQAIDRVEEYVPWSDFFLNECQSQRDDRSCEQ